MVARLAVFTASLRYLLIIACAITFGLDMYLVSLHHRYEQIVFLWRFYVHTPVTGFIFWIFVLSPSAIRLARKARPEAVLPLSTSEFTVPAKSDKIHKQHTIFKSCCNVFLNVTRVILLLVSAAALLNATIHCFVRSSHAVIYLPFSRKSPQADFISYSSYDPRDLFDCPTVDWDNKLTIVCLFDQTILQLVTFIGGLAILEAICTSILQDRVRRAYIRNYHMASSAKADRFERSQLQSPPVELSALSASLVVQPHPVLPHETEPAGYRPNYQSHAVVIPVVETHSPDLHRTLPPLPPREDDGTDGNRVYLAAAMP
ncbi:hypothetical protein BGW38_009617, partial [Lunasporangiospora selenospora]